jgi:hypothetical protein
MRHGHPSLGRLILLVGLAAALVAGCGTSGPATAGPATAGPATSPAAASATPASPAPGGSNGLASSRPVGAYSLTLPAGWRSVQIGSNYAAIATAYNAVNLRFATSLASQLLALPKSASTYAYDESDATVRSGAVVAVTVTEVVLPATVTLDAFSTEIGRQVSLLVETPIQPVRIQTASGPADQYAYQAPLNTSAAGTEVAAITQVLIVAPGRGYVLTFGTAPARAATDAPVFARIASSFALLP